MKAIFIAYNQAYGEEIVELLDEYGQRGFTQWIDIQGRGGDKGEPHYGNHAWPSMCSGIITMVDDNKVDIVLEKLHAMDVATEKLGLRAFVWNIEQSI